MNADDYYNSDDARGVSPGFKPIPLTSTPKTTKPDSQSQTDASTLVSSESASGPGARARARLKRRKNPGEAILLHFFAPNHPELQSGKRCDCIEPCNHNESGSDSPTDPPSSPRVVVKQEMTASIEEDPDDASSPRNGRSRRGSPKASLVRRAQGAAQVAKSAVLSPFFRSKRESGSSDEEIEGASSRRGSRSRTRAKLERKRSSQQNHATISSFDHPLKRPRTAENGVRSTDSVEMLSPTSSDASVGLSDTLRPLMILNERRADTLAPLSAHSPADAPSPVDGFRLPSVAMDLVRETSSMGRSRASSSVSVSTMNSTPRPTPHHMGYGPIPCNDNTSTPLSAGAMSSASSYFTEHSRRTPRSNPPPRLHKYASSTHSVGSLTSVPELTPHATTSSNGDTPSDMATPPSRPPVERPRRREVSPPPMPANYIQVEHPIPGYKCTHDGCDAPPFPTPYTLSSHAKKHSQDRPYFCDVPGCKRSEGGRDGRGGSGFKRKNEMVRHGLVHTTPGYACPWCTDAQKVYPRPDNLLRHARDHHKDKDVESDELRDILNRRLVPTQSRGRKKRTSSDGKRQDVITTC